MVSGTLAAADHSMQGWDRRLAEEYERLRVTEPIITNDVSDVTKALGTSLEGLQYSVKTASSTDDKLARVLKDWDIERAFDPVKQMHAFKDMIRYTEICKHEDIINITEKTIEEMEKKGYVLTGVKNYYANPFVPTGYMGVHLNFVSPIGRRMELQVHSPESFSAKQEGHRLYEKIRAVGTLTSEKEQLIRKICEIHKSVEKPKGYERLHDYKMSPNRERALVAQRMDAVEVDLQKSRNAGAETESVVYTVSVDGTPVLHGFECHFSDESIWSYKNMIDKGSAEFACINAEGAEISVKQAATKFVTLAHVRKMAFDQEKAHSEWMKTYLPRGLSPEQDVTLNRPMHGGKER